MSTQYYFGDDDDVDSDVLSNDALPFPKPLDRSAFLTPTFSAADFLSSLSNRFQTLEDLQAELQQLLQSLNKELVDLVNDHYQDFLSLGKTLSGGEERIEEVRVGLLGFQRDVTGLRDLVAKRSEDVRKLVDEKRELRSNIRTGRTLLEIADRIEELEVRLAISRPILQAASSTQNEPEDTIGDFKQWSSEWDQGAASDPDDDEDDFDIANTSGVPGRLRRNVEQCLVIKLLERKVGVQHPFLLGQRDRMNKIRETLGRNLEAVVRAESDTKRKQTIIQFRARLDDE